MTASIELVPFNDVAGLRAARADWSRAFEQAAVDPLSNSPSWGLAFASAWLEEQDVFGWTARANGDVVGFLPLRREPRRSRFALRRALFLSDGTFDSDYLDLLVREDLRAEVLRAFLEALEQRAGIDALVLSGLPGDSPTLSLLRETLAEKKRPFRERDAPCVAATLPASFDDYLRALPKRMRSKVRKALREAEGHASLHTWCTQANLEESLELLFALHAARWNAVDHEGSFEDPRRRDFYSGLAREWADSESLRLVRLELDGEVIAIQFGVRLGETYYQIQEGYDPAHEAWRPATALRGLAIRDLIDEGVKRYDFLGGDSRHKRDWGGELLPCRTIAFPLGSLRANMAYRLRALLDARAKA